MRPNFAFKAGNTGFSVAGDPAVVLPSAVVTSRQLLAASLKVLFHRSGAKAIDAAAATGIDNATISKFQLAEGERWRWPRADHFDALATFFRIEPWVLLNPEAALTATVRVLRASDRDTDANGRVTDTWPARSAHSLDRSQGLPVDSSSAPHDEEGGPATMQRHADQKLLDVFTDYWDAISFEARLELVKHGRELSKAEVATAAKRLG